MSSRNIQMEHQMSNPTSSARDKYTYRVTWSDEDNEYVGLCTEFPSLSWLASTRDEALHGVEALVRDVVADMKARGEAVPEPMAAHDFSGTFKVRIPAALHRRLVMEAADSAVSLNRLVSMKLASTETYGETPRLAPARPAARPRVRREKRRSA
jgi:predicted HicB family RNase H-like nuclease